MSEGKEEKIKEIKTGNLSGNFGYGSVSGPKDPQLMAIAKVLIALNNEISSVKTDKITAALENVKTPKTPEGTKLKQDIVIILKMHYQLYLALNNAISSIVDIDNNMNEDKEEEAFGGINEMLEPHVYERMYNLSNIKAQQAMIRAAEILMNDLTAEGFEVPEIREFFTQLIANDI
jgi:hypothetical protein